LYDDAGFTWVRAATAGAYSHTGKPSIDSAVATTSAAVDDTAVVLNVKKLLKSMARKSAVYQRVRVPSDVLIYKKLCSLLFLIFVFFCNKNRNVFKIQIP